MAKTNGSARVGRIRLLAGVVVALVAFSSTTPVMALPPQGQRHAGIWVRMDTVPRRVRETIDRERGRHEVKQIIEFRLDGRVYYRVLIDERGTDRAIVVSEFGRVMAENEVPDLPTGRGWFERPIRYDDLPWEVRRTLDTERNRSPVKSIQFVRRDSREFYRCIVDTRGDDLAIRINTLGKLLSVEECEDVAVGRESVRYDTSREIAVRFETLPREVRQAAEREARGLAIKQVILVERNGRRFYRITIDERHGDRVIRLAEDGYVYSEQEVPDIAVGQGGWDKNRFGHEQRMRYEDLPWHVQRTLDDERRNRPIKDIVYVRRGNFSFYRCLIDARGDDLAIRISDHGTLLTREQVEDTAYGRAETERPVQNREEWVKYRTLSPEAQRTLDRVRRDRDIIKIIRMDTGGRVIYRCTIDTHPWPTTVHITEDGRVLGF